MHSFLLFDMLFCAYIIVITLSTPINSMTSTKWKKQERIWTRWACSLSATRSHYFLATLTLLLTCSFLSEEPSGF